MTAEAAVGAVMEQGRAVADVVVVGAGIAGYSAAIAAARAGASCLLLEKQARGGGSSVLSGGFFALYGTPEQAEAGVEDSASRLLDDLWDVSGHRADRALLEVYVDQNRALHDWLTSLGVVFSEPELSSGQSVARSHQTDMRRLVSLLADEAGLVGVRTVSNARVTRLRTDHGSGGRVVGCQVDVDGEEVVVTAERGVVLCTGGFTHGKDLLETFAPEQSGSLPVGGEGNVGDGLRMAWQLGADLRDMAYIKATFGSHPDATKPQEHAILLTFYKGSVIVNAAGQRFVDESISYKDIGDAGLAQPGHLGFQVFDSKIAAACNNGIPLFDLKDALARGLLLTSDDLGELARRAGIDGAALAGTLDRYNGDVRDRGRDTVLGRSALCHNAGALVPIDTPPFYAYPSTTALLATYCGVRIRPDTQVVDVWGDPIIGLRAAGEVTGGFHGRAYMTGTSLGKAAVFGRIAGQQAAAAPTG